MINLYYKWRYKRAQRAGSFKLPRNNRSRRLPRINLGSYLNQSSVRGRTFNRFDLPIKRKRGLQLLALLATLMILSWLVYESMNALAMLSDK
jgi:hypothetical protein